MRNEPRGRMNGVSLEIPCQTCVAATPAKAGRQHDRSRQAGHPLATAGPPEATVEESRHSADYLAGEQPQPADRSDAVPAKLNRPIKLAAMLLASWKTITASWNQVLVQSCRMTAFSLPRSKRLQKPRAPSGERVSKRSKLPQSCYRFLQSLPLFPTEW